MLTLQNLSKTTLGTALISLSAIAPAAAVSFYSVTELPFLPSDINDISQIVGENYLWSKGNLTDLNTLPGASTDGTFANAINNNGFIAGTLYFGTGYNSGEQAFISDGSTITEIDRFDICGGGYSCSNLVATDINDAGQVALIALPPASSRRYGAYGLLRDTDGTITSLLSARYIPNLAINNSGQAIGKAAGAGQNNTFFFNNGTQAELLSPVGAPYNYDYTVDAFGINDRGQVVGSGAISWFDENGNSSYRIKAMLWNDPNTNRVGIELGGFGGSYQGFGYRESEAKSINEAEQIVGFSYTPTNTEHAFLWEEGTMFDLNNFIASDLGWELSSGLKINNKGEIIGTGIFNGQQRGFLLTPTSATVPEPTSALSLLGFGAVGIGVLFKRQQQQKKIG